MKISILIVILSLFKLSYELDKFKYRTILDHNDNVRLEWNLDEIDKEKFITFNLIIITEQIPIIIGFGASDRGQFNNADLVVFKVKYDRVNFIDAHTDDDGILKKDNNSNYIFLDYEINNLNQLKQIELKFKRKLDTCDANDYRIELGTNHLIHFILTKFDLYPNLKSLYLNEFRPELDSDSHDMKHAQLLRSTYFDEYKKKFDPNKSKYFDVRNNNINLPAEDTTYWCLAYKLDQRFTNKHHIIAFESLISNSSRGIVHHMELFHCITDPSENMKTYNGPCKSEEKPAGLTQCRKVVAAWAMGASRFVYPDEVGGVIGGNGYSLYMVLEIHYDNAYLRNDIIDSSGIRIYYQGGPDEKLRKYDAGIMEVGLEYNSKNSIPPKIESFHLHGYCLSECTKLGFKKSKGITVFASQLHTHLTGRKVWTSLVRNNRVIKLINSDNHYDQMFQEIRLLQEPVRIRPGDAIVNTCVYETMTRSNMTFGGYSIRDEMCVNYMHYYPASDLEVCKSSISDRVLNAFFDRMNYYDSSNTSIDKSIEDNFNSIRWTKLTSKILSKLYDKSTISFSCNSSDGEHLKEVYERNNENIYFDLPKIRNLKSDSAPISNEFKTDCYNSDYEYIYEDKYDDYENDY